jgi:hypothetical protein
MLNRLRIPYNCGTVRIGGLFFVIEKLTLAASLRMPKFTPPLN